MSEEKMAKLPQLEIIIDKDHVDWVRDYTMTCVDVFEHVVGQGADEQRLVSSSHNMNGRVFGIHEMPNNGGYIVTGGDFKDRDDFKQHCSDYLSSVRHSAKSAPKVVYDTCVPNIYGGKY